MHPVTIWFRGERFAVLDADAALSAAACGASAHDMLRDGLGAGRFARLLDRDPTPDDLRELAALVWSDLSGTTLSDALVSSPLSDLVNTGAAA